jgi:hypothetical protein
MASALRGEWVAYAPHRQDPDVFLPPPVVQTRSVRTVAGSPSTELLRRRLSMPRCSTEILFPKPPR